MYRTVLAATLVAMSLVSPATAQIDRRPLSIEDFLALERVADPQVSPDGQWVVYTVIAPDLAANTRASDLWLVSTDSGAPRRISDRRSGGRAARWSPDGTRIAYVTSRGPSQIRVYNTRTRRFRTVTALGTGADGVIWSPTGTHLAFVSDVAPACSD
jgi:Tol biopolymer transport system component